MDEFLDIPRFYTALAQWLACMVFVMATPKRRLKTLKLALACAVFLIAQIALLVNTGQIFGFLWPVFMSFSFVLMLLMLKVTCNNSNMLACYQAIQAFAMAEFAASLTWQVHSFIWLGQTAPTLQATAVLFVGYSSVFAVLWYMRQVFMQQPDDDLLRPKQLLTVAAIMLTAFTISNLGFLTINTPFSGHYHREIFNIRTIIGLCGLFALGAYNVTRREIKSQLELSMMQGLLVNRFEQYEHLKERQEWISRKHHDLKHIIAYLKAEENPNHREALLHTLEDELAAGDVHYHTEHPVLDTLLANYGMHCVENRISFTCMADGSLLSFMDIMDMCTLFGNAMDNAIQHTSSITDPEKRLINLSVSAKREHLVIRLENYMTGKLRLSGGLLPPTTKPDKTYHGYGLKSIRYVAEKYQGIMTLEQDNSWFILQVVIPIAQSPQ